MTFVIFLCYNTCHIKYLVASSLIMLTFYDSNILINIEKINEIVVKKLQFSQNIQNVPLNEINVPYGTLFYEDNSVKLIKLRPRKNGQSYKTQTVPKMPNKKLKTPT